MKNLLFLFAIICTTFACEAPSDEIPVVVNGPSTSRVSYGDHPLQDFDIHLPGNHSDETKVVIMVHGGGWVMGYEPEAEVTTFDGRYGWDILTPILNEGYACVVMKYRTACYNTVPEEFNGNTTFYQNQMMEDIDLVIDYLKDNAATLEIADNHFQLIGESGGGHIVMTYGIRSDSDPALKSVVSMFGPTDLDAQDFKEIINEVPLLLATPPNYFLKRSNDCLSISNQQVNTFFSLKSFADHHEVSVTDANPFLAEISTTTPANIQRDIPMFITHGSEDELVPASQASAMFDAVQEKFDAAVCEADDLSCQLKLSLYENCGHGWTGGNCEKSQVMEDIKNWILAH